MSRLERLGYTKKPTYTPGGIFMGMYWYKGNVRMFHEDSWFVELINEEELCQSE